MNAVVQARTGSSRLPGKVLRPLVDASVLGWVVRAARAAEGVDEVVVATSVLPGDDAVAEEAARLGVSVTRGSEDDVLSRFLQAADDHPADALVRLTADCPFLDPALIAQTVGVWRADPTQDYVATTLERTLPRGLDVELATVAALRAVSGTATGHHRTHVTSGLYADPERFRLTGVVVAPRADDLRVTLDTPADAELIEAVAAELGPGPHPWRSVVALLRARPDLVALNADVVQKPLEAG
ncbi:cytidylyltransferase domain-containing protein [Modestobacter sp. SYSU DS0511]